MNKPTPAQFPAFVWRLLLAAALLAVFLASNSRAAETDCSVSKVKPVSWVFAQSRYTHDPSTGARVAQYMPIAPVEPLPDPRAVTSGYNRSRTVLRGADGAVDSYIRVQSYGNGRGGIDAEWERFHNAWRRSTISGGEYRGRPPIGYGLGYPSFGYGGYPAYGNPGYGGYGGYGPAPGYGNPGYGNPGYGY